MKNYKVEATMKFTDKEEKISRIPYDEKLTEEENEKRGSIFYCTKERYEFLKKNNAVKLIYVVEEKKEEVIEEEQEEDLKKDSDEVIEEIITKKRKSSKN